MKVQNTILTELIHLVDSLDADLSALVESHRRLMEQVEKVNHLFAELHKKVEQVGKAAEDAPLSEGQTDWLTLFASAREMQEMGTSFNLQYLQLQQNIQNENRQFTMVTNIMKNKHDTAKNSINNIR
jgi:hypothetical protein